MKSIGIKLADGSFYPVLEEGSAETKDLELTTVKDNQTKVILDLYRSETNSMDDAEYVDSLEITNLNPHPNGEPNLNLQLNLDENNQLHARMVDSETGNSSQTQVSLVTRTFEERTAPANFALNDSDAGILPGVEAVSTILNNANDMEFNFDPSADMSDLPEINNDDDLDLNLGALDFDEPSPVAEKNPFDDEDTKVDVESLDFDGINEEPVSSISDDESTTLDMSTLEFDGLTEATVDSNFITDPQVIDDNMVSDQPLTDEDLLDPETIFADNSETFVDKDGTGFSFEDDTEPSPVAETKTEEPAFDEYQVPQSLLDSSLFDDISQTSNQESDETPEIDNDIEPPAIDDLELDDVDDGGFGFDEPLETETVAKEPEVERDPILDPIVESSNDFGLPSFDDFNSDETFAEIDIPKVNEDNENLDSNIEENVAEKTVEPDLPDYDLPDFDDLPSTIDSEIEPTFEINQDTELESETVDESSEIDLTIPPTDDQEVVAADSNDFALPDINDALSGIGDVDLSDTSEPAPEEKPQDDFDLGLPSFDENGFAQTNDDFAMDDFSKTDYTKDSFDLPPLVDPNVLHLDDETDFDSVTDSADKSFSIDDMDLPDFDNLDANTESKLTTPSDLPDFDDPFDSLSSPTADTDFEFPDFDDSPTKMELASETVRSDTSDIFGDFDDTDAVFEGDIDGFTDPTVGKKKNKKSSYGSYNEFSDDEKDEKENRKPIIFLLAALLACLVVILILVIQTKPKKPGEQLAQSNDTTKNSVVTSMGTPRNDAEIRDVIRDTDLVEDSSAVNTSVEESKNQNAVTESKSENQIAKTDDKKSATVEEIKESKTETTVVPAKTEPDKKSDEVKRPTVETATKVEAPKTVVIPAKEDTIIIASKPETVVPLKKDPVSSTGTDIKYTVVWGDTLWDISTAYYKTPYRYNRIAEYNGLSDANRIKSGQVILIPVE